MIPRSKKVTSSVIPAGMSAQLSQASTISTITEEKVETPVTQVTVPEVSEPVKAAEPAKKEKDVQLSIRIPEEIKTKWKLLFTGSNLTITQGIIFAIEHLTHEIDNGEAVLTIGGVINKKPKAE